MMRNLLTALCAAAGMCVSAQIGVGTTQIQSSEILSIAPSLPSETNSRGVLIPRVALTSETDNTTIANPTPLLAVYNTTNNATITKGFYLWNGTMWERAYDKTAVL